MPDLDPQKDYILVVIPHTTSPQLFSGTPLELTNIAEAGGRIDITRHDTAPTHDFDDGRGEVAEEWFDGPGLYVLIHDREPRGPYNFRTAIHEAFGYDANTTILIPQDEAAAYTADRANWQGHKRIEAMRLIDRHLSSR